MIDDLDIPMWAGDDEALREEKRKRNEHWWRMRRARSEWMEITGYSHSVADPSFWKWLEETYGLVPDKDDSGNIKAGFTITDEKLYTLFLLKFSQ